ncbi:MAG: hypothetical protein K0S76_1462 [Herbinix sp.]|jgi:uncharacterized membrane protein YdbT with pleckstrin-like domain|nr:hypothetical protein [Herbinix sp.]
MKRQKNDQIVYREKKRWLAFGLPFTFTTYTIQEDKVSIKEGFLSQKTNDCYMYKVQDITLQRSIMERIFRLGTIVCYTGDVTHPTLTLKHIKKSKIIKEYLFNTSEQARIKRRTVNMLDIGVDDAGSDEI